jgi:phosphoribosylglycinamide formyltransferase 1
MKKVCVMASGEGSNFSAIVKSGIVVDKVITDNASANVVKRAATANVPCEVFDRTELEYSNAPQRSVGGRTKSSAMFENKILQAVPEDTDLVVLAGYCSILSAHFCEAWAGKIINIHPSLLPAFAGTIHAIEEAWNHGCKVFGITVHYVTEEVDAGPIIMQRAIHLLEGDTLESLTAKLHTVEHYLYPEAIRSILQIKIK